MKNTNLGYCCINTTLQKEGITTNRYFRKKFFTKERAAKVALENVIDLKKIIEWNKKNNIKLFRISSQLFPFADHEDVGYKLSELSTFKDIKKVLESCNFGRLTMHPDPYVCLASPKEDVVNRSIASIEMHAQIGEILQNEGFVINIHIGGMYGEAPEIVAKRFISSFNKLSENAKKWLVVENDDKCSLWNVSKLYKHIYSQIGTPITFDFHHHTICNEGESHKEALNLCKKTWKTKQLTHYSEGRNGPTDRAHSEMIKSLPKFNNIDIEIEAKGKELAILSII